MHMTKKELQKRDAERKRRAKYLKGYRTINARMFQSDFAKRLGIPLATYAKYERGERMAPDAILNKIKKLPQEVWV